MKRKLISLGVAALTVGALAVGVASPVTAAPAHQIVYLHIFEPGNAPPGLNDCLSVTVDDSAAPADGQGVVEEVTYAAHCVVIP